MRIVAHVTEAELRGTPFKEYQAVLHNLIGERCRDVDDIDIILADHAEVIIDDRSDSDEAREILEMAQQMTRPDLKDGYFG